LIATELEAKESVKIQRCHPFMKAMQGPFRLSPLKGRNRKLPPERRIHPAWHAWKPPNTAGKPGILSRLKSALPAARGQCAITTPLNAAKVRSGGYLAWIEPLSSSIALILLAGIFALTPGCSLLRAPTQVVTAVVPGKASSQPDPVEEQIQLQRYVDDFIARTGQALDQCAERQGTDEARVDAIRLKLTSGSSVISIVSGPNPSANLLDLVSVTVLTRMTIHDYWMKQPNGPVFQPWLDVSLVLETNVWRLAARFLEPAQVEELRQGISQWYARSPETRTAFYARPSEFASMVRTTKEKGASMNSVFSLVNLDPTAGLDPAVREVTRTRLFAERAMFTFQRMPFLLRLQTELLAYELTAQPSVQLVLKNSTKLSDSAELIGRAADSISESVAKLPDRIAEERKEILATLDLQESKLKDLVVEVDRTLVSGAKMSDSLNVTITNFGGLMREFGVGEPTTNAVAPDTNSPPFNILDYAKTADHVDSLAKDLNALVISVNQSVPEIQRLSQQAGADVQKAVDHGFRLGLVLIAVLLAGAVLAGLLYRFLAEKLKRPAAAGAKQ
jgi:hypothetical protein